MKPVKANVLRHAISGLLLGTGIFHLVVALIGSSEALRAPLALFGVLYTILGLWTRTGGRTSVLSALIVTALGLGLGGAQYVQNGGPLALPAMFAIDIAILVLGGIWLRGERRGPSTS